MTVEAAPIETLKARRFEQVVMPHLDSAYNLARWLTRNDADAQDVVQEAMLRAFKYFDGFDGQYGHAWLLKIVRNTCFTWLRENRSHNDAVPLEDNLDAVDRDASALQINAQGLGRSPELVVGDLRDARRLDALIEELPAAYREVIIMREMDDLSYQEIADITGMPMGTVMSRLARARQMLQTGLRKLGYGAPPS
jgi:RNA polymerase sigma-70 factor (ECF subfamily)